MNAQTIGIPELCQLTGRRRSAAHDLTTRPGFPAPMKLGKSYRWFLDEVLAWMETQRVTERSTRAPRSTAPAVVQEPLWTERPNRSRVA